MCLLRGFLECVELRHPSRRRRRTREGETRRAVGMQQLGPFLISVEPASERPDDSRDLRLSQLAGKNGATKGVERRRRRIELAHCGGMRMAHEHCRGQRARHPPKKLPSTE